MQGFSNEELAALSEGIDPMQDIDLAYYPLAGTLVLSSFR